MKTGARKILLHGTRMWPQMIDKMFWTFAMKYIAKRLNSLQIDHKGRTSGCILHIVNVEDIPVKSVHKLFIPNCLQYARLQNSEGAVPPKW